MAMQSRITREVIMYSIKGKQIKALLEIAAKKDTRWYLNGILFDHKGYAMASDGHALLALKINAEPEARDFIMAREQAEKLSKLNDTCVLRLDGEKIVADHYGGQSFANAINAKSIEWRRVIPRTFSPSPINLNPELAIKFTKAMKFLNGGRGNLIPTFHAMDAEAAVLVRNLSRDTPALGVIMPVRVDPITSEQLVDEVATFLGESK
jgi:hypothetical protein